MMQMIQSNSNSNSNNNTSELRGHDTLTQMRIHSLTERIFDESDIFKYLGVPRLHFENNPTMFELEQIEVDQPILLSEIHKEEWAQPLIQEVVTAWAMLWSHGFALYDFKLYRQKTGKILLFDFEHFGFRQQIGTKETITFPFEMKSPLQYFFHHPCFSPCFEWRLLNLPETLRVDMSKILKKE